MNKIFKNFKIYLIKRNLCFGLLMLILSGELTFACTGISLRSKDGGVVVSRTVEWALSDAQHNKVLIVPRAKSFVAQTPEGNNGKTWKSKYGFVTLTAYGQPFGPDGLNEEGSVSYTHLPLPTTPYV